MKVVITGGAGFIGFRLAERLLELGALVGPSGAAEPIDELVLFDASAPPKRLERPGIATKAVTGDIACLLYTSPSPRDQRGSRMPSSA